MRACNCSHAVVHIICTEAKAGAVARCSFKSHGLISMFMHCLVWQPGNIAQYALGGDGNRNTRIKIVGSIHLAIKHRPLYLSGTTAGQLSQHTDCLYFVAFGVFFFVFIIRRDLAKNARYNCFTESFAGVVPTLPEYRHMLS